MPAVTELRVRYAETDQMGVVYNANYFVWAEIARTDLMRAAGLTYKQMEEEHGMILPVIENSCRYKAAARYDDDILIESWPTLVRGPIVKFGYRIYRKLDEEGRELLAECASAHVCCDKQMAKRALPAAFSAALKRMQQEAESAQAGE